MLRIDSTIIGALVTRSDAGGGRVSDDDARPPSADRADPGRPDPRQPAPTGATASGDDAARDGSDATRQPRQEGGESSVDPTPAGSATVDPSPPHGDGPGRTPPPGSWQAWLDSPPGRYVLQWEQAQFDAAVADVFGYHAVQFGEPQLDALRANRMPHRVRALLGDDPAPVDHPAVRVQHFEELPFDAQSLDLIVMPHALEFASDPHQVLREADRVLRPEGRLIVSGFNPISLWGARQLGLRGVLRPFLPREGHFIGVPRLRDWCKLLDFEPDRARYGCWRPPCRTQLWLDRMRFLERAGDRWWPICGAVYLVSATKRVRGMRLIGPAWKKAKARRAIAVPTAQRRGLPPAPPS